MHGEKWMLCMSVFLYLCSYVLAYVHIISMWESANVASFPGVCKIGKECLVRATLFMHACVKFLGNLHTTLLHWNNSLYTLVYLLKGHTAGVIMLSMRYVHAFRRLWCQNCHCLIEQQWVCIVLLEEIGKASFTCCDNYLKWMNQRKTFASKSWVFHSHFFHRAINFA